MMLYPMLVAGGLTLLASTAQLPAEAPRQIAGHAATPEPFASVPQIPADAFPTAEMAAQFAAYLRWAKANGLSRLAAFERLDPAQQHLSPDLSTQRSLPTAAMREQFAAYLRWTRQQGLSPYYAFRVASFD